METSIYRYILKHSLRGQILLIVLTATSFPILYAALEIPKVIVNNALSGRNIPESLLGFRLDQISYLLALCFAFLGLIMLNGALKYVINVYQGVLGERLLRRLRYELYRHIQRFPLPHFKRVSQGEIIPMIVSETEALGAFIGEAFAVPALQGGIVVTYMFFIFRQDVFLGLAAIALYPFQLYLIPKLQRRINELSRERVRTVRRLADRVGEDISGIAEIHAHDTSRFERADIGHWLGAIFELRYDIYRRKFFIKFLNNFLAQLTPFFFYSVGGYFVIRGELSLGALVAVLAAFKDLTSPWKDLLRYYEIKEDARVKYAQIVEQFQPPGMIDARFLDEEPEQAGSLAGDLVAINLGYSEDGIVKSVDGASFRIASGDHVAIVGLPASGKQELGRLLARLLWPSAGRITVGDRNLLELPEAVLGRRMGYVDQNAHIFAGTVADNIVYGLKHLPLAPPQYEGAQARRREREEREALKTGNSAHDIRADWIDYAAAGASGSDELVQRTLELLPVVEMEPDVYQLGLQGRVDPQAQPEVVQRLLEARTEARKRLEDPKFAHLVEPFDLDRFNTNMTVAENLLFGTPRDDSIDPENVTANAYVRRLLHDTGLMGEFLARGQRLAEIMVDLFADVPPGSELFEQFSFISAEDLPMFRRLVMRAKESGVEALTPDEQTLLCSLPFKLVPARHRLGIIDEDLQARLLEARRLFARGSAAEGAPLVEFFDPERYHPTISIQDNILFGKIEYGQAQAQTRVGELLRETIEALDLRGEIVRVGLGFEVGIAGSRLQYALRQKLAIARCLLKEPDIVILNEATGALDAFSEARLLDSMRAHLRGRTLVCVLGRADMGRRFDRVLVMEAGKVAEQGPSSELEDSGSVFRQLLHAV
jgi:putative ABC transport system ATP-binding protein